MDFCLSYVIMIVCVCEEHSGSRVCLIDSLLKYTGQIKKNIVNIGHVEFVWINRTNPIIYTWIKCSFAGQQQHLSTNRTPDSGPVPTVLPTVCSVWGSGVEWCPLRCPASGSTISNSSISPSRSPLVCCRGPGGAVNISASVPGAVTPVFVLFSVMFECVLLRTSPVCW